MVALKRPRTFSFSPSVPMHWMPRVPLSKVRVSVPKQAVDAMPPIVTTASDGTSTGSVPGSG